VVGRSDSSGGPRRRVGRDRRAVVGRLHRYECDARAGGDLFGARRAPVWKSTSATGAPDNSSPSHFSAMTRPSWLGRAVRNRHRHAIEQALHRWRGGRRDDSARTRRKILISTHPRAGGPRRPGPATASRPRACRAGTRPRRPRARSVTPRRRRPPRLESEARPRARRTCAPRGQTPRPLRRRRRRPRGT
jgi:hypothetical protein